MSVFGTLWTASNMAAAQASLLSDANGTNASVTQCAKLDAGTRSSWESFYTTVHAFCVQVPANFFPIGDEVLVTGERADQLQAYQRELYAWQQKLSPVCQLTLPSVNPTLSSIDPAALTAIKYAAVAAGFVGAAYVTAKVVDLVRERQSAHR